MDEIKKGVLSELKKFPELKSFVKLINASGCNQTEADVAVRRRDHISHFILRLAYCRTEDLRRWFLKRELELFRLRWFSLTSEGKNKFLQINGLNYKSINDAERQSLMEYSHGMLTSGVEYFQVPFVEVADLVRTRRVFLRHGFAFITSSDIISVISFLFRAQLAQELVITSRKLPQLEQADERVFHNLTSLPHCYTGKDYSIVQNKNSVSIENLEALSKISYPLCMRHMHNTLRKEHHLRHGGRQQYGLFLKGIGVSLEDALRFWRDEFTQRPDIDNEKFDKNYAYNIRHNFGREGKKVNYTPYSCIKIISQSLGAQDQHGCPFKHWDLAKLKTTISQIAPSATGVQELANLATQGHYQLACTKLFELTHNGVIPDGGVNHPNQYFEQSQAVLSGNLDSVKKENVPPQQHKLPPKKESTESQNKDNSLWDDINLEDMEF
ncbi:DNA primase large subunit-like isoform X2 [Lycorma delicatula]